MNANDEMFMKLERELFAAHEGTPDLTTIDRLSGRWRLVGWQGASLPAEA